MWASLSWRAFNVKQAGSTHTFFRTHCPICLFSISARWFSFPSCCTRNDNLFKAKVMQFSCTHTHTYTYWPAFFQRAHSMLCMCAHDVNLVLSVWRICTSDNLLLIAIGFFEIATNGVRAGQSWLHACTNKLRMRRWFAQKCLITKIHNLNNLYLKIKKK